MTDTDKKLRLDAQNFALEAYGKMKNNRAYALTPEAKAGLAALARAMFLRRINEGRNETDANPSSWKEFFGIIQKLADSGANVLQKRPGDAPPVPKPWLDPVTGTALPNPWLTKDLKAQTLLQQRDPDLAEHYKAMASDPYGTLAKLQDAEAARTTMEQISYGEAEHAVNPFRRDDMAEQSAFIKNAPPALVEFCKSEANNVAIPIFGSSAAKNLTVESVLAKDPAIFALVKNAQQIHATWNRADRAAAQAARDEADAKIRELQGVAA